MEEIADVHAIAANTLLMPLIAARLYLCHWSAAITTPLMPLIAARLDLCHWSAAITTGSS